MKTFKPSEEIDAEQAAKGQAKYGGDLESNNVSLLDTIRHAREENADERKYLEHAEREALKLHARIADLQQQVFDWCDNANEQAKRGEAQCATITNLHRTIADLAKQNTDLTIKARF